LFEEPLVGLLELDAGSAGLVYSGVELIRPFPELDSVLSFDEPLVGLVEPAEGEAGVLYSGDALIRPSSVVDLVLSPEDPLVGRVDPFAGCVTPDGSELILPSPWLSLLPEEPLVGRPPYDGFVPPFCGLSILSVALPIPVSRLGLGLDGLL
jgi:hypothetical protein